MFNIKYFLVVWVLCLIIACEQPYNPEKLDQSKKIPVVTGQITNKEPPNVTLKYAAGFKEEVGSSINNATVYINDKTEGKRYLMVNKNGKGQYVPQDNSFQGKQGYTYQLSFTLPDGRDFKSQPATIRSEAQIDSLYASISTRETIEKNPYGEVITNQSRGLSYYLDLSTGTGGKQAYFRVESTVTTQSTYTLGGGGILDTVYYCWQTQMLNEIPLTDATSAFQGGQAVRKLNIGFTPYEVNDIDGAVSPEIPVGWIVQYNIFRINENAYQYFMQLQNQLTDEQAMFDPVPSQIEGNIYAVEDTSATILGFFEVAAQTNDVEVFHWSRGRENYIQIDNDSLSRYLGSGCTMNEEPSFWVNVFE